MSRLTRKMMGQVVLPMILMEIKSKEDLEKWHEVRREYEAMVIKLAEYEDREETEPKGIVLQNIDLTGISELDQGLKMIEEYKEFKDSVADYILEKNEKIKEHVIEEYFDLLQSALGLLDKLGIPVEEVMKEYPKHEEKLKNRPRSK